MRCLHAVFGYKLFLNTINYFRRLYTTFGHHILLLTAIYYFWRAYTSLDGFQRLYTTFDSYIPLSTAIYYFWRLYTTFSFTLLWFCKNQRLPAIYHICGLKATLKFNISLLALIHFSVIQWFLLQILIYAFESAVLLEILKCWKCKTSSACSTNDSQGKQVSQQ